MSKTIAIADDHELVRRGLRELLTQEEMVVVAEAANGLEAVRVVERHKPDVLLLDISMPVLDGIEAIRELRYASKRTAIIVLSMHLDERFVARAFKEGAMGFVSKQTPASEIVTAVREATLGRRYLSSLFSQPAIDAYLERLDGQNDRPWNRLTDREREVCRLAVEGSTNREIAEALSISQRTVESHRASLMRKFGVRTQTELVLFVVRNSVIPDLLNQ